MRGCGKGQFVAFAQGRCGYLAIGPVLLTHEGLQVVIDEWWLRSAASTADGRHILQASRRSGPLNRCPRFVNCNVGGEGQVLKAFYHGSAAVRNDEDNPSRGARFCRARRARRLGCRTGQGHPVVHCCRRSKPLDP